MGFYIKNCVYAWTISNLFDLAKEWRKNSQSRNVSRSTYLLSKTDFLEIQFPIYSKILCFRTTKQQSDLSHYNCLTVFNLNIEHLVENFTDIFSNLKIKIGFH